MDGPFIVLFLALGVPLVFVASIGTAFRGRSGRRFGVVTLALGLAGLVVGWLVVDLFPHNISLIHI